MLLLLLPILVYIVGSACLGVLHVIVMVESCGICVILFLAYLITLRLVLPILMSMPWNPINTATITQSINPATVLIMVTILTTPPLLSKS